MNTYAEVPPGTINPDEWIARQERSDAILSAVRSGSWLDEQTFPPLRYAIPGVIAEGTSILSGAPKVGKSWLSLSIALAVASGGKALDAIDVDPRPVLYFGLEDGDRRMQDRARKLLKGDPIPTGFHYVTRPLKGSSVRETLEAFIDRQPETGLVVIDLLAKIRQSSSANESQYQADYRSVETYQQISAAKPGLSIVIVHHTRKAGSDDFIDATSGTQGIAGAGDAVMVLSRDRHSDDGLLSIAGREVMEAEYALRRVSTGGWQLTGASLAEAQEAATRVRAAAKLDRTSSLTQDIDRLVNSRESTTAADVVEALGIAESTARQALKRGVEAGRIDRIERGIYCPLITVSQVSRVTNDQDSHPDKSSQLVTRDRSDTHIRDSHLSLIDIEGDRR